MAKGKSTWKYNKLLTARRNYFLPGGTIDTIKASDLGKPTLGLTDEEFTRIGDQMNSFANDAYAGKHYVQDTNNSNTGVGKAGAITGLAAQGATDIANMISSIEGKGITARANQIADSARAAQMNAQAANDTFDTLTADWANNRKISHISAKDLGATSGGGIFGNALTQGASGAAAGSSLGPWGAIGGAIGGITTSLVGSLFGNSKAKREARRVNGIIDYTNDFNERSLVNRANNLVNSQMSNLESNYAAFGGPLGFTGGAIDYSFMTDYLNAKKLAAEGQDKSLTSLPNSFAKGGGMTHGADFTNGLLAIDNGGSHETNPYEGVPMGVDQEGTPNLVEEGETIFNDYVFSKRLMVPKAIREKYKLRGTKNLSFADASKKLAKESEERPNDPISIRGLQALMADLANAQEELKAKNQGNSFANGGRVNKFVGGGNKQIATENLTESEAWSRLMAPQIKQRLRDIAAIEDATARKQAAIDFMNSMNSLQTSYGSDIYGRTTWGGNTVKGGKAHQLAWQGAGLNTYSPEDYSYVFQDRGRSQDVKDIWADDLIGNHTILRNLGMAGYNTADLDELRELSQAVGLNYGTNGTSNPLMWWSEAAQASTPQAAGPEEPVVQSEPTTPAERKKGVRYYYNTGTRENPNYVLVEGQDNAPLWLRNNKYYFNSSSDVSEGDTDYTDYYYDPNEEFTQGKYADWLRYAPAVGFGISSITDALGLTNKPDYSNADAVLEATRNAGTYSPVKFNPVGNYLRYTPFDREFYINQLNAQSGATRRAALQNAGLNRGAGMAAILAADYNAQGQLGQLARQAEEYNLAQRQKTEEFNRGTNMFNSEGMLKADMANQEALAKMRDFNLRGTLAAAQMREQARAASDAARSANLSGLFQTLGDIGFEEKNARMRDWAITHGVFGPGTEDYGRVKSTTKSNGGKIKRKKRGLTR